MTRPIHKFSSPDQQHERTEAWSTFGAGAWSEQDAGSQVMGPDGEPVRSGIEQTLNYLLDDIEMLILPRDVQSAFALLVQFIECDGAAAESSRDEDWEVQQAFQRAIALLAQASPQVPRDQRERAAAHLRSENSYGLRVGVREALG